MSDLADFLRARYADRRAIAIAATRGRAGIWTQADPERKHGWVEDEAGNTVVYDEGSPTGEQAHHIATNAPADVLADLDAKLALLEDLLAEGHERNEEDHWYSCAALTDEDGNALCFDESRAPGPCDCGRDTRVNRQLRILARPFAGHPDYKEDWAT